MLNNHRTLFSLTLGIALVATVATLSVDRTQSDTTQNQVHADDEMGDSGAMLLAGRYHMRGRTTRFFKRSSNTNRSYRTSKSSISKPAVEASEAKVEKNKSVDVKKSKPAEVKKAKKDIAARYHLRGRTKRFFGRSMA